MVSDIKITNSKYQIFNYNFIELLQFVNRTDDHMQQLVAAEALIAATQKKKDSNFIVSNGVEILKQLYKSKNDHIKVPIILNKLNNLFAWSK